MRRSLTARIVVPFLLLSGAAYALIVWSAATAARRAVEERALQQAREISRLLAKSGFLLNAGMLGHVKSAADADIVDVSYGAPRGSTLSREDTERVAKAADPQRPFAEAGRYRVVAMREGETSLVFAWEAEKLAAAKSAATRPLLMLASGSFLCVLALGVLIGRAMLRPVGALLAGAERVAAGDETRDVLVTSGDELQRLAEAFNRMQAAIRRHREDARWAAAGRVAAGVAHDLRNPLTGVLMMAQMLERDEPDAGKRETLGRIVAEVKRLDKSVADLMAMAGPAGAPRRDPVDLAAIARESAEHFRAQAGHRGVVLEARDEGAPAFSGDPSHVRRILDNLVANAIEATPARGRVNVVTAARSGRAELRVEDTGSGISEAVRAKLFEAFTSDKPGGTGLGLATVKRLVDEMGGEITVESGGAGTVMRVLF